jgi:hypothetical protein
LSWGRGSDRSLISFVTFIISFPETKNIFRSLNQNSQGKCKNPHSFAVTTRKLPETSTGVKPAGNTYENMAFQQRVLTVLPGFSCMRR